ncbi:uncharacterized protein N7511_004399 [Penicillium nucicola]|uniref:uncharacterized protein n=1 Tax=Penicillium nucicola TaxID=1850975 RepID=UPI0025455A0B|nr:uncharacterized protein N7511_004399 [Penicillium nucicola]KAJ5766783.1 hypothetical protein N7511_004399 [Penicillium nucicola]
MAARWRSIISPHSCWCFWWKVFARFPFLPYMSLLASDEVHDVNDPILTTFARHRQPATQRPVSASADSQFRPPSASDSQRTLRRVRREPETRQNLHRRAVSLDASPHPHPQPAHTRQSSVQQPPASGIAALRPALSEAHTDDNGSTVDDPYQLLDTSYWPQRTTGVSSRTASAILFALEDAIRGPLQLSTDWDEVNASMSDMVGVAGPPGPMGNGRPQNGGARVPQNLNPVSGSSQPPSGMRTPTDIMRQRRDREARRKAEQDARDREQEELERQQLKHEQAQIQAEAQARAQAQQYSAAISGDNASQSRTRIPRASRAAEAQPDTVPVSGPPAGQQPAPPTTSAGPVAGQSRPVQTSSQQPRGETASQHGRSKSAAAAGAQTGPSGFSKPAQPAAAAASSATAQSLQQPRRVGFPHAFERWETLSSHWEGLTSYWMRKLEQHNEDLERDPVSQQLARQITDLSAAGANLFHAVVELQRLRASSERKFQRWFFDTRAEQERAKEVQADLDRQLKAERQGRADAFAAVQTAEKDKVHAEELLKEMRRELQISKEEARRAWEELGRREQEERDRTNSLRNGEPTLVGGVQVVPMISGVPSRHNTTNRPQTREGPYPSGPTATSMGTDAYGKPTGPSTSGQYYEDGTPMSPTGSDPFIEPKKTDPPATSKAPYSGQLYEHQNTSMPYATAQPTTSEPDDRSYVGSSDAGDEEYAHYAHDAQGHPLSYPPPLSEGSEEYDNSPEDDRHYMPDGAYTSAASSAPSQAPYPPVSAADYSGAGWGPGTGWESVTPVIATRLDSVMSLKRMSRVGPVRVVRVSGVAARLVAVFFSGCFGWLRLSYVHKM